jgi:hypothetical protein
VTEIFSIPNDISLAVEGIMSRLLTRRRMPMTPRRTILASTAPNRGNGGEEIRL